MHIDFAHEIETKNVFLEGAKLNVFRNEKGYLTLSKLHEQLDKPGKSVVENTANDLGKKLMECWLNVLNVAWQKQDRRTLKDRRKINLKPLENVSL